MINLNTIPIVIYHANCADGFTAAWCFHIHSNGIEGKYQFHPGIYNETPPDVSNRLVYLVDFSYKRGVVKKMLDSGATVCLIDHHKTALEDLEGLEKEYPYFKTFTDINRSGAMLTWDFLYNVEFDFAGAMFENNRGSGKYIYPPYLLEIVQDRDLWRFLLPHSKEINAAIFSYEYTFENWDMLMAYKKENIEMLIREGAAIARKHAKDIKELVPACMRFMIIGGHPVPVASFPYTMASEAGHLMASMYNAGLHFSACYYDTASHRVFSLRSCDNGMDVSAIALMYNGGGHKHAAGFRVDRSHELACI